ncbi:MAG: TIGR03364 family FAD-dependent oxidoreductase [Microcoleaceae cyanobacterium]
MSRQIDQVDVVIVGGGIVGLAHALAAAKRGLKVVVFERNLQAVGASIRNFGMIWPIGQPAGPLRERAMKSRQIWLAVSQKAGFAAEQTGSLHLAYQEDEMAVLEEFVATVGDQLGTVELLTPDRVPDKSPAVNPDGLLGALWSSTEVIVDPREAIAKIPGLLQTEYGVEFQFGTVVSEIDPPQIVTTQGTWRAEQVFICSGVDFQTLYPEHYASSGLTKVKLQMMRTIPQPDQFRIGAALCAGLTLTHYSAFAHCQTLGALKDRIQAETPWFPHWGIHVMASQNASGELILGDSHEYGLNPDPFDRAEINRYILDYLEGFLRVPALEIAETWHGVYAKLPGSTEFVQQIEPGITVVNGLSGAGMTLSFGLAEEVLTSQGIAAC